MGNIHTMHRIARFSIPPRHAAALVRAGQAIRCLATVGVLAGIASSCSSLAPSGSSAAYTHSAQSLVAVITQMAARKETVPSPSLTSSAPPRKTPSATVAPTVTPSVIPTVQLSSPSPHFRRATYSGSTPTTNGTSLLTSTITTRCNAAYFVGDVAPIFENSEVKAGATFVKTWVIRNVGTCTWYPSYMLYWHSGARMEGPAYIDFPEIIPPNKYLFLSVTLVAPDEPGKYYQRWYIRDPEFNQFGIGPNYSDPLMVRITVVA